MYYKTTNNQITAYSKLDLEGFTRAPLLKNHITNYKIVNDELCLEPNMFKPKTVKEFDDLLERVHADDQLAFDDTRLKLIQSDNKQTARTMIRQRKDIEDDLTDNKQVIQWLLYAVLDLYNALPQSQKDTLKYKNVMSNFYGLMMNDTTKLRVDVEPDPSAKLAKVLQDEIDFAEIVKTEYFDKVV